MSDPHKNDYCVVCGRMPKPGLHLYPVKGIKNGVICENCLANPLEIIKVNIEDSILDKQANSFDIPNLPFEEEADN